MEDDRLEQALMRAEYALKRIIRSVGDRPAQPAAAEAPRDDELRAKVRGAIAELDQLIREAAH